MPFRVNPLIYKSKPVSLKLSHSTDTSLQCPDYCSAMSAGLKLREILRHKTIYNKRDLRMTVEGMLYRMRTGCPWRDLPKAFGNWNKVYKRFNAWSATGKWLLNSTHKCNAHPCINFVRRLPAQAFSRA